ncbi:hypothetical protein [Saccharopolyspora elongata]|uniref:hypothetical protein n=1 Tax=Saccharopolyspora elongata TaxID=2530387 RepID=UPI001F16EAFD|nr:hypothetical protein [Saccharopolyspora elongata]
MSLAFEPGETRRVVRVPEIVVCRVKLAKDLLSTLRGQIFQPDVFFARIGEVGALLDRPHCQPTLIGPDTLG